MKHKSEKRKLTVGLLSSWFFGVIFLLAGLGTLANSIVGGIIIILCSLMIIPVFENMISKKLNFEISGGVKILLVIVIFATVMVVGPDEDVLVQTVVVENNEGSTQTTEPEIQETSVQEKPKVKSASITIDRVQITAANLYPTRISVINTGDVTIRPKFDVYAYDVSGKEVCSGSPIIDEFSSLSSGEKKTGEISIMACMFDEDGTYDLRIDMLDKDYNKLDSATEEFEVNYWGAFDI